MKYISLIFLLLICHVTVFAQNLSNLRKQKIKAHSDIVRLPDENIIPGSISLKNENGKLFVTNLYSVDYKNKTIVFSKPVSTNLILEYRVFSNNSLQSYALRSPPNDSIKPIVLQADEKDIQNKNNFFQNSSIRKKGSISRGLTVGTNNDPGLNSQMSLQLSGELSPGVFLNAALSDDNIPVQPDGTTQNIREFDKIFVEIGNKRHRLAGGDIISDNSVGLFLKSKKKVQGLQYNYLPDKDSVLELQANAAVGKGKFRRMKFNAIEGNQGPYRLTGANNENFIIILAGSERIFVDGKQIERGEEHDYIINYNTAELSFTTRFPVNKDNRIIAEFEYSERNYTRFLTGANIKAKKNNSRFFFGVLSENDAKNQSIADFINDSLKTILRNAGDDPSRAVILSETLIDSIASDRIAYIKTDTLVDNMSYKNIYVYKAIPEMGNYYVEFSYTGKNKGNYIRATEAVNGKVYKWVAPVNGMPQGDYAPVKQLISPKSMTFANIGGKTRINKYHSVEYELAASASDDNLFSDLDDENNVGYALRAATLSQSDSSAGYIIGLRTHYTHTGRNFRTFENFRSIEFERDYNLKSIDNNKNSDLIEAELFFSKEKSDFSLSGNYFKIKNKFTAGKYKGEYNYKGEKLQIGHKISYLNGKQDSLQSQFLRYRSFASFCFKPFSVSISNEGERNVYSVTNWDSASYRYNTVSVSVNSHDNAQIPFSLNVSQREDFKPETDRFLYLSKSFNTKLETTPINDKNQSLKLNFNYRSLSGKDSSFYKNTVRKNLSGMLSYRLGLLRNSLSFNVLVEHKSGRRMKKDFKYLEVAAGQGQYVWEDFNENNIAEIDEFVVSAFPAEANYIRVQLPSDQYKAVYEQKADFSCLFVPARLSERTDLPIFNLIKPFSFQSSFSNHRAFAAEGKAFDIYIADSLLFEQQKIFNSKLFFKSFGGLFQAFYLYKNSVNNINKINGISSQKSDIHKVEATFFFHKFRLLPYISAGKESYEAEFPKSGNYDIVKQEYAIKSKIFLSKKFEIMPFGILKNKLNKSGQEELQQYEAGLVLQAKNLGNGIVETELKYTNNVFSGKEKTATAYKMMNGLKSGNNFNWNVTLRVKISKYLELNVLYSGRKSANHTAIHTGSVSVRAVF